MKRQEKPLFVDNLTQEFKGISSLVAINYTGLTVKLQQELKKQLKGINTQMLVAKNTLIKRAGEKAQLAKDFLTDTVLQGPTALIITQGDPIAPLQILAKFSAKYELPQFKAGVIEGSFHDAQSLTLLSRLPAKEVLVSQAVGAIASPMYSMVYTLQGNLQKLVFLLTSKSEMR